nr:hypothetical protein DA06_20430 [Georgenia sp. SUBG003]
MVTSEQRGASAFSVRDQILHDVGRSCALVDVITEEDHMRHVTVDENIPETSKRTQVAMHVTYEC